MLNIINSTFTYSSTSLTGDLKNPFLKTSCGNINRSLLHPASPDHKNVEEMLPTDTGSRIGIIVSLLQGNHYLLQKI